MYLERKFLKQFYKEILDWVDKGMAENSVFKSDTGLCENLKRWFYNEDMEYYQDILYSTVELQYWIFLQKYNSRHYPFCGVKEYVSEQEQKSIYQNPVRIAFLRSQVAVVL